MYENLLIIGNGMASVRLCEELATRCPEKFAVSICGAEPQPGYNRVLLSAYLAGASSFEDIALRGRDWYAHANMELHTNCPVTSIDPATRCAHLADGRRLAFDRLVFATGSRPILPALPGIGLPGVFAFRNLSDAGQLRKLGVAGAEVVVIGGGLLGIEAAYGLKCSGASVTLVHLMDRLMERQLDGTAASLLKASLTARGIRVELGAETRCITGDAHATGIVLADGRSLPADAVVCAIGIRPNADLARTAGLAVNRGIVVDDGLCSSMSRVYALGECAEHRGSVYGLVAPAYEQAEVLACRLAGESEVHYQGSVLATNLKVSGVKLFSVGDFMGTQAGATFSVLEDRDAGAYRKLVFENDRLVGAILAGDTNEALWYKDLIEAGVNVSAMRNQMIFGRDYVAAPHRAAA